MCDCRVGWIEFSGVQGESTEDSLRDPGLRAIVDMYLRRDDGDDPTPADVG